MHVSSSTFSGPWSAVAQGVCRIQRRPLFGTQCRPVGGPAGFEPHLHRTATCPHTCGGACPNTYISEPRPKAQVPCTLSPAGNCAFRGEEGITTSFSTSRRQDLVELHHHIRAGLLPAFHACQENLGIFFMQLHMTEAHKSRKFRYSITFKNISVCFAGSFSWHSGASTPSNFG